MDVLAVSAEITPQAAGFIGAGVHMGLADVAAAAKRWGCGLAALQAVLDVESSGSGFDALGRPKILFEPHILFRELARDPEKQLAAVRAGLAYAKQGTMPYPPTSEGNYQRLKRACLIDADAAMHSTSWGVAQVMGFNFAICGYACVADLVQDCMDSEEGGFELLLDYCDHNGLVDALRNRDWATFARGYNGSGAVAAYAAKLVAAYAHHAGPSPATVLAFPGVAKPVQAAAAASVPPAFVKSAVTADSLNDQEWLAVRAGTA